LTKFFFRTTFSVLEEKTKALLNHYLTIFSPNNNEYFYEFGCVIIVLYVSEWCTLNAIKVTWHKLWIFISFFLVSISRYFSLRGCSFIYYWAQSNDWIVRLKYFFLRIFFEKERVQLMREKKGLDFFSKASLYRDVKNNTFRIKHYQIISA